MVHHQSAENTAAVPTITTRRLANLALPAIIVGVVSALSLYAVTKIAAVGQDWLWTALPQTFGVAAGTRWWPIAILTLTGILVGVIIQWFPGHGGPDPRRSGLVAEPLGLSVTPGLALALIIGLAGGVSLGPENPMIAINVAIAVWFLVRPARGISAPMAEGLAAAGTLGAMFASPLAAILLLADSTQGKAHHLFDRLFAPLCAASAGAITIRILGAESLAGGVPAYDNPSTWDILSGPLIAVIAAGITLLAVWLMPALHRFFHSFRSPVVGLGLGGLALGLLGWLGGYDQITLFKGLEETHHLLREAPHAGWGVWLLLGFALIKVVAITVSAGAGFRGGLIFPAVFIGAAIGQAAVTIAPSIPPAVAVGCGILGAVVMMSRDGWASLLIAGIVVNDPRVLALLSVAMIPVWLLARTAPLMQLPPSDQPEFRGLTPIAPAPGTR